MECTGKYLLEFRALLCPVVSESLSDITRISRSLPRKNRTGNETAYLSRSDETHHFLKENHRHRIYLTLISYKFVEKIPLIKDVDVLDRTEYEKMVILMVVVGMGAKEIADILLTDIRTVNTLKSRRKADISDIISKISA